MSPNVILAKYSKRREKYLSPVIPSTGKKMLVQIWDKHFDRGNRKLILGVDAQILDTDQFVVLPPDYLLEEIEKSEVVKNVIKPKETVKMENVTPAPEKNKKEIRFQLKTAIKDIRDKRKTVSVETIAIKKQLQSIEGRAGRKPLVEQIKKNVALRKTMSDDIKNLAGEIKALKAK